MRHRLLSVAQGVCRRSSTLAVDWESARPYEEIPGPKPLPVIGNTWRFLPGIGDIDTSDFTSFVKHFYEKYGDIVRIEKVYGRKDFVLLFDPHDIEKALRSEGRWPTRDSLACLKYYRTVYNKEFYGHAGGLAVAQGEKWQILRSKLNPVMMQPRAVKPYVVTIDKVAQDFVERMRQLRDKKSELPGNFIEELYKWSLESIALVALDTRLGCLDPDHTPDSEPATMIKAVNTMFDCSFELELQVSPWRLIPTPAWRRFVKANEIFNKIAMKYVDAAMERIAGHSPDDDRDRSVLESLLIREGDPKLAILMAIDMMIAGVDTTSHSVANVLYYLAVNPDVQEKLYQEIVTFVPDSEISNEAIDKMEYLKACIKEAMRISGVTIGNVRENTNDNLVLRNYRIPKGVDLLLCHQHISNLDEHYPEAKLFRPERWLRGPDGHSEAQKTHPFVTMPFGFGPRMCVGRRFAELEITTLLIRMLKNFRIEYHYGEIKHETKFLVYVAMPLKFKLIDRD